MAPSVLTSKKIPLLISEVKTRRCLWDTTNENYSDIYHTGMAWNEISEKLNIPVSSLKVKWKNLRDTLMKINKLNKTTNTNYTGKWPYYHRLAFLNSASAPDIKDENKDNDDEGKQATEDDLKSESESENDKNDVPDNEMVCSNDEDECEEYSDTRTSKNSVPFSFNHDDSDETDDQYDLLFLESLAPFFSKLDPMRKLVLRSRIQDMLLKEVVAKNNSQVS